MPEVLLLPRGGAVQHPLEADRREVVGHGQEVRHRLAGPVRDHEELLWDGLVWVVGFKAVL